MESHWLSWVTGGHSSSRMNSRILPDHGILTFKAPHHITSSPMEKRKMPLRSWRIWWESAETVEMIFIRLCLNGEIHHLKASTHLQCKGWWDAERGPNFRHPRSNCKKVLRRMMMWKQWRDKKLSRKFIMTKMRKILGSYRKGTMYGYSLNYLVGENGRVVEWGRSYRLENI